MNRKLYSRILESIDRKIKYVINEQFNIGNMNLTNNKSKRNMNIFNKYIVDPFLIYDKILKNEQITDKEINDLNQLVSVVKVKNKNELKIISKYYTKYYPEESMNWLNVSAITDMSLLFKGKNLDLIENEYNGDISQWDVSNVIIMESMFEFSVFNQDISGWDVSNVRNMSWMFASNVYFEYDISEWDISNVTNMTGMFFQTVDNINNIDMSKWNVSNVTNMSNMFYKSNFNGDISQWNVSKVRDMHKMFSYSKFNQNISQWNVSNVRDMSEMFQCAWNFNKDISNWNVNKVKIYNNIFDNSIIKEQYKPKKFR